MTKATFRELYDAELKKPTPAAKFISDVAAVTCRKENTVRMWLAGRQFPDQLTRKQIASAFGVDAESLFPEEKEEL